jgi:hypothetical protein
MKCRICHRELKNPKSIEKGFGAICLKKWKAGYRGVQVIIEENTQELENKLK